LVGSKDGAYNAPNVISLITLLALKVYWPETDALNCKA